LHSRHPSFTVGHLAKNSSVIEMLCITQWVVLIVSTNITDCAEFEV
jgi:hypothetical protein